MKFVVEDFTYLGGKTLLRCKKDKKIQIFYRQTTDILRRVFVQKLGLLVSNKEHRKLKIFQRFMVR